jgi:hypothetical protein
MSEELENLSIRYYQMNERAKEYEQEKAQARNEFLNAVTSVVEDEVQPYSSERVSARSEEECLRICSRMYRRHRVISVQETKDPGEWDVLLEPDPALQPYSYVNRADGKVYSRIIAEGSPYLDDESLRDEKPDLWQQITVEETTRVLKPLEELPAEVLAELEPYITMPEPQVRMGAPRKATLEELE